MTFAPSAANSRAIPAPIPPPPPVISATRPWSMLGTAFQPLLFGSPQGPDEPAAARAFEDEWTPTLQRAGELADR